MDTKYLSKCFCISLMSTAKKSPLLGYKLISYIGTYEVNDYEWSTINI